MPSLDGHEEADPESESQFQGIVSNFRNTQILDFCRNLTVVGKNWIGFAKEWEWDGGNR
jgi:hypothetical protein